MDSVNRDSVLLSTNSSRYGENLNKRALDGERGRSVYSPRNENFAWSLFIYTCFFLHTSFNEAFIYIYIYYNLLILLQLFNP